MKLNKDQLRQMKSSKEGLLEKNIIQWSQHCEKLEAKEVLSEDEQEDLIYRRIQVKKWIAQRDSK